VNHLVRISSPALLGLLTLLAGACGESGESVPIHDRLWLTAVPKTPKDEVSAFLILRASEAQQYGFLFKGSLLRGSYDTFQWAPDGDERAKLTTVQDGRVHKIRVETCEPTAGFHYCVQLHGDPQGTVRYQSRKRWGLGRPKAKLLGFDLAGELNALAAEDGELATALAELAAAGVDGAAGDGVASTVASTVAGAATP